MVIESPSGQWLQPSNTRKYCITYIQFTPQTQKSLINEDGSGLISSEKDRFDNWCNENNVTPSYMILQFIDNDEYLDSDIIINLKEQESNLVFIYLK